ncbi:MAG: hypothetical protein QW128_06580 [Thermoprotei archaeon]
MLGEAYYLSIDYFMNRPNHIIITAAIVGVFAATNKNLPTSIILVSEIFSLVALLQKCDKKA